jgi:methyltransferase (TIGR00027 family)
MAKTGIGEQLGTAEGAIMSRAIHAKFAEDPILDDHWAIELLAPENRARVEQATDARSIEVTPGFDATPIFALGVASLRYAEDEVERCAERGIGQYLILGAGFDTFALRRGDLSERVRVYEVDHPDVQALKRARIDAAERRPAALPCFVPVDFESTSLSVELRKSDFDSSRPAVLSWLNTIPYLTTEATVSTMKEIHAVLAPGSRVVVNYGAHVPLTPEQGAFLARLQEVVQSSGEPTRSRWAPEDFVKMMSDIGFEVVEHATEADLTARYFSGRGDGLKPGVPGRIITAERRG